MPGMFILSSIEYGSDAIFRFLLMKFNFIRP